MLSTQAYEQYKKDVFQYLYTGEFGISINTIQTLAKKYNQELSAEQRERIVNDIIGYITPESSLVYQLFLNNMRRHLSSFLLTGITVNFSMAKMGMSVSTKSNAGLSLLLLTTMLAKATYDAQVVRSQQQLRMQTVLTLIGSDKVNTLMQIVHEMNHGRTGYLADPRLKALFHRENFTHFLEHNDHLVIPVAAEFWPSLSCNAGCDYCPYRKNGARKEADMKFGPTKSHDIEDLNPGLEISNTAIATRVAEEFSLMGGKSIIITGGGEPFINPDIDKIIEIFHQKGLEIGIFSNGIEPNIGQKIDNIIKLNPTFVRLSVNSGSAEGHYREYKVEPYEGKNSYEMLKENALKYLNAIKTHASTTTFGFGYVLFGDEDPTVYEGIADFLNEMYDRSGGLPMNAQIRTKHVYYRGNGDAITEPSSREIQYFPQITEKVNAHLIPRLKHPEVTRVLLNENAINYILSDDIRVKCFSSGWVTSFTEKGDGYLFSENNGSPHGLQWFDYQNQKMNEAWSSARRIGWQKDYATGEKVTPMHHKLTPLELFLYRIRTETGNTPFTKKEVNEFWKKFDAYKCPEPPHKNHM